MKTRTYLLGCWGLFGMVACSAGAPSAARHVPLTANGVNEPIAQLQPPERVRAEQRSASSKAPLEYHEESEADRVFIENAERAIRQYSEFLARAGDSAEFAPAVKRSREQIEDLRAAIIFVREGAAQRAVH